MALFKRCTFWSSWYEIDMLNSADSALPTETGGQFKQKILLFLSQLHKKRHDWNFYVEKCSEKIIIYSAHSWDLFMLFSYSIWYMMLTLYIWVVLQWHMHWSRVWYEIIAKRLCSLLDFIELSSQVGILSPCSSVKLMIAPSKSFVYWYGIVS